MDTVFKLHSCPLTITSDRDPVFVSQFWTEFLSCLGIQLQLSTAYHPQTDGQSEVVNRCLETYLRCMCSDTPEHWLHWLPLAEWWYNTSFHSAIQASLYKVMFGQPPPLNLPYLPNESKNALVNRSLQKREEALRLLKFHLQRAQHRMKQLADKRRSECSFIIGDYVLVKLHAYKQLSLQGRCNAKLSAKYEGPFCITAKVGTVAYRLQLPVGSKAHHVFHVSQLKLFKGPLPPTGTSPALTDVRLKEPKCILARKTVKRRNRPVTKVLVKWKHHLDEDATWEFYYDLLKKFPSFDP